MNKSASVVLASSILCGVLASPVLAETRTFAGEIDMERWAESPVDVGDYVIGKISWIPDDSCENCISVTTFSLILNDGKTVGIGDFVSIHDNPGLSYSYFDETDQKWRFQAFLSGEATLGDYGPNYLEMSLQQYDRDGDDIEETVFTIGFYDGPSVATVAHGNILDGYELPASDFNINAGLNDAFISKFNAAGSALTYSTYHGGSMDDFGNGIAVDASGNAYVAGTTESANFPIANAFQSNLIGTMDSFVTKVNSAGDTLVYSSYLGGSNDDLGNDVAVDGLGNAFVAGTTESTNFPIKSVQDNLAGGSDSFVSKIQEAEGTGGTGGGTGVGGGGGGDCFIATVANGSPMVWRLQLLDAIFILFALLSITLSVLLRKLKLCEDVFKTARVRSK